MDSLGLSSGVVAETKKSLTRLPTALNCHHHQSSAHKPKRLLHPAAFLSALALLLLLRHNNNNKHIIIMVMWKKSKNADADTCSTTSSILVSSSSPHKSSKRSKRKVKRRHSVDFAGATDVVEIESADEDCKGDMWYSKDEFNLIRERNTLVCLVSTLSPFELIA